MNVKEQVEWERKCAELGAEKYYATQDKLRAKGQEDRLDASQSAMRSRLPRVADQLQRIATARSGTSGAISVYTKLLQDVNTFLSYETMAYIGMQVVLSQLGEHKKKGNNNVVNICGIIGERIETELKCAVFHKENPKYLEKICEEFKGKTLHYDHKRKVIMAKGREYLSTWNPWGSRNKIGIGSKVLEAISHSMPDLLIVTTMYEKKKRITKILTTPEYDDWIAEFEHERGLLSPSYKPCLIPPLDWTEDGVGGYYTPRMQTNLPFVKTKSKEHRAFVDAHPPRAHMLAANKLQKTKWKINTKVLDVIEALLKEGSGIGMPQRLPIKPPPFPEHLNIDKSQYDQSMWDEFIIWKEAAKLSHDEEAQRAGKLQSFLTTLDLAREMRDLEEMYFVYTACFRGRLYSATSKLSSQGDDVARGLLTFAVGRVLGKRGGYWLAAKGAAHFGISGNTDDLVQWTKDHSQGILRIAGDPLIHTEWSKAEEPYKFLAFCFEWADTNQGSPDAVSHLPVGIDGRCNGLQHISAMLRDEAGATATNLRNIDKPNSAYTKVADAVMANLGKLVGDGWARWFQELGMGKESVKRQVMTLPYGSTKQSCRDYTHAWLTSIWGETGLPVEKKYPATMYIVPHIWQAIEEQLPAALYLRKWLQDYTGREYMRWISPVGFPVYQYYKEVEGERVYTRLNGGIRLSCRDINHPGKPNIYKQKLGIVPNLTHSVDGSHLVLVVNNSNFEAYSMVHDEYATHAADVDEMIAVTQKTFYHLHHDLEPLKLWMKHQGIPMEAHPPVGTFDISEVLRSKYMFSV